MTDLQFFISLQERLDIKYYKVDENNAFVTYEIDTEDPYDCAIDNEMYCFEIALPGKLSDKPHLISDSSKVKEVLVRADTNEQLHYMRILIENLQEKVQSL